MKDYSEKRDFQRMPMDCPLRYRIPGGEISAAIARNLSSSGLLFNSEVEIPPGTRLNLEILPGKSITPPLSAEAQVLRSDADGSGNFLIACSIERILGDQETGPDFP
jgi:hypothetical protein